MCLIQIVAETNAVTVQPTINKRIKRKNSNPRLKTLTGFDRK